MSKHKNCVSRRHFLLGSVALGLGLPGCSPVTPEPPEKPVTPPPGTSDNVIYYSQDDREYARLRQPFNKRIQKSPKVIAACLNEAGISEAIHYARYYQLPVAIKSGGHSFEGFSVNDDGMVIDLSRMNGMSYDPETQLFTAEPGCKLGKVYSYLNRFGRILPAGSCAGVGLAGLTLGGGYGFFSRQMGLTCDNLQQIRMVDGLGNVHQNDEQDELLWASRGGGNGNFGVASRFVFRTHPAPVNFTSYLHKFHQLDSAKAKALLKQWFGWMSDLPNSCYGSFILGHRSCTVLVTDIRDQATPALQNILNQIRAQASETRPPSTVPLMQAVERYEGRPGPLYFKNVSAGYYQGFADLEQVFAPMHERMKQQASSLLQINTLGGAIADSTLADGAAYPHRHMPYLGELQVYYEREEQGENAEKTVNEIQQMLSNAGIGKHYRNYPDIGLPDWQQAYYGNNYGRLQQLKKRLDPENRFQHPQSVR